MITPPPEETKKSRKDELNESRPSIPHTGSKKSITHNFNQKVSSSIDHSDQSMVHLVSGVSGKFKGLARQHSVSSKPLDSNLDESNFPNKPKIGGYKSEFQLDHDGERFEHGELENDVDVRH